jgi:hypothetical protein
LWGKKKKKKKKKEEEEEEEEEAKKTRDRFPMLPLPRRSISVPKQ